MKIVIEGAGEVGRHLAKMMANEGNEVTVIDKDQSRLALLRSVADVVTIFGNPSSVEVLKEADCGNADLFISVNPMTSQDVNIVSAVIAKHLGAKRVIARTDIEDYLFKDNNLLFKEMGIEFVFYPEKFAAHEIVTQLKHTASTDSMDFAKGKIRMVVFRLEEGSRLFDMDLRQFSMDVSKDPGHNFRVVAVASEGKTIIPSPDYKFRYHDLLFIVAKPEGIDAVTEYLGKSNIEVNNVMILGASRITEIVANKLSGQGVKVKVLEKDMDKCYALSKVLDESITVVNRDGRNSDVLLDENIKGCDAFVSLTQNDETNILACVMAKKLGVERTIAEVESLEYIRLAEEMGVDAIINKKLLTAARLFRFTYSGQGRTVKKMSGTDAEILEYTAQKGSRVTKQQVKDLNFPKNAIIASVSRGKDAFIAVGNTQIEDFDKVVVFALPGSSDEVDKFFK